MFKPTEPSRMLFMSLRRSMSGTKGSSPAASAILVVKRPLLLRATTPVVVGMLGAKKPWTPQKRVAKTTAVFMIGRVKGRVNTPVSRWGWEEGKKGVREVSYCGEA